MQGRTPLQNAIHDLRNELALIAMDVHQLKAARHDDAAFNDAAAALRRRIRSMTDMLEKAANAEAQPERA